MPAARPSRSPARLVAVAVAVVALVAGTVGCSGDEDIARDDFEEKLVERTEIPEAAAACITDRVYAEFEQGQINAIVQAATVKELPDDAEGTLEVINRECLAAEPG
ncbi:MAG TPA: hypothetical protein VEW93_13155 [Acidimicrobiales bacterium]|nr:hypothetical protein [Acidimicrobiales bacterium]